MFKNKLKIISAILIIFLLLTTFVKANNEVPSSRIFSDNGIMPISDDPERPISNSEDLDSATNVTNIPSSNDTDNYLTEEYKDGDVYLAGNNVVVDYVIDGNLFVFANSVTINSNISGDVFVFANNVTIGENGYILNNLFAFCSSLNLKGVSYNVYSVSDNINISGYVYRDLRTACNNLTISGIIHRNAFVSAESIDFVSSSSDDSSINSLTPIKGNLNYSSKQELNIPQDKISGSINYTHIATSDHAFSIHDLLISIGTTIATIVLIWLLIQWRLPKFEKNTNIIFTKKILPLLGFGLLSLLITPIAVIILLLLGITSNFALLLLALYMVILGISTSLFVIGINNFICNKLNISKTIGIFGMLIITAAVIKLLTLIPYLGGFISLFAIIIGMGYFVTSIITKEEIA